MILDRNETLLVSSIGWIERGGFVVRDISTGAIAEFLGEEDAFVRLFAIDGDRFLVACHSHDRNDLLLSVRRFCAPAEVLWSLHVTPHGSKAQGDASAASGIRQHHLVTFKIADRWTHRLVTISLDRSRALLGELLWYNSDSYDLGYQGLTDAIATPHGDTVLVSVQRSSIVVVHNPQTGGEKGRFELAGRSGNPMLTVVRSQLWTIDYDTFVSVDLSKQRVIRKVLVQPEVRGCGQFAGELFVWEAGRKAVVPRPFSGDVAIIEPDSGTFEGTVPLGRQPLSCVVTAHGRVIARDWQSGEWLEGQMPKRKKSWWRVWH